MHTFTNGVTLFNTPTQSITATDTVSSSITGTQGGIAVSPAPASHLVVDGFPSPTVAGVAHDVTVTAKDPWENTDTNYAGIVHFSSTDGLPFAATLPGNYTFTTGSGADNGVHTFTNGVTLFNTPTQSITATDTVSSITGTQGGITVNPGSLDPSTVADPGAQVAGTAFTLSLTAYDAYANVKTDYTGLQCLAFSGPADSPVPVNQGPLYPVKGTCGANNRSEVRFASGVADGSTVGPRPTMTAYNAASTTVTVTDVPTSKTGTSTSFTVKPAPATSLAFSDPAHRPRSMLDLSTQRRARRTTASACLQPRRRRIRALCRVPAVSLPIQVLVRDLYGNLATNYATGLSVSLKVTSTAQVLQTATESLTTGIASFPTPTRSALPPWAPTR